MEIFNLVKTSWIGVFEIFLMGLCGFLLIRKKILPADTSKILSRLVMDLTLPFLIFSKIVIHFDFGRFKFWWLLPFIAMAMVFIGFCLSKFLSKGIDKKIKREFISLCSYQNSGYLPLAIIGSMFQSEIADTLFIYVFLFLAGFNFLIWSVGVFYLKYNVSDVKLNGKSFFTPPFIAILFSLILVALGIENYIPDVILTPVSKIGASTIPLGIIAIGAILGEVKFRLGYQMKSIIEIILIKLMALPIVTLIVLNLVKLPVWMEFFIFLESLMPSATSLGIISRRYHAQYSYIANAIFITHVCSLITIPVFIAVYYKLFI